MLCNQGGDGEQSLGDMDLPCVVAQSALLTSAVTATSGGNLRFWVTQGENLSDAIWEVAARMEDSKERPR